MIGALAVQKRDRAIFYLQVDHIVAHIIQVIMIFVQREGLRCAAAKVNDCFQTRALAAAGRTHQIRAHMASIGCPILGDSKYGNNSANRELKLKYQALCAYELTMPRFTQPDFAFLSGKTFRAPKPWYYNQVLDGTLK